MRQPGNRTRIIVYSTSNLLCEALARRTLTGLRHYGLVAEAFELNEVKKVYETS